jgi:hypothetical protein
MHGNNRVAAVSIMSEHNDLSGEMERRFGELRADMERGFGAISVEMHRGFGTIRVEMADRNAELLKWLLIYGAAQTAALAAVMALLR